MFDEPRVSNFAPTSEAFMPTLDNSGDPTDGLVAIRDHILTRHIWLRRCEDISPDGITRWPLSIYAQAEDLDADKARRVAPELLAATDLIDSRGFAV